VVGGEALPVAALPTLVRPGDLLVFNDVHVHRARLRCRRASGGAVEVLLARPLGDAWEALLRPARRLAPGERLAAGDGYVELGDPLGGGSWRVRCSPAAAALVAAVGEVPLPPYLRRAARPEDEERYQTVYARAGEMEAAAAPTAGLHFTPALLAALDAAGAWRVSLTLEVGLGTFQPLDERALATGRLHPERYHLPRETWDAVLRTRAGGGRVVAVGTTVARVLEAATGPGVGETDIFIREGHPWQAVDVLFTNFHLPRSSLLMLVCAFAGRERILESYRRALALGFRFYSYGDAMWVQRH
jgi:S-adenosylmethionine:tRNA ribosyltransferase-isomerase